MSWKVREELRVPHPNADFVLRWIGVCMQLRVGGFTSSARSCRREESWTRNEGREGVFQCGLG